MSFMSLPTSWADSKDAPSAFMPAAFTPEAVKTALAGATPTAVAEFWAQFLQPWATWWQVPASFWQSATPFTFPWANLQWPGAAATPAAKAKPAAVKLVAEPVAKAVVKAPAVKPVSAVVTPIKAAQRAKPVKTKPDDLTLVEGIGPKIAAKLIDAGIAHFTTLANASTERLNSILESAGPRFKLARPDTWAEQAQLLAKGDMAAFEKLTTELRAGLRA